MSNYRSEADFMEIWKSVNAVKRLPNIDKKNYSKFLCLHPRNLLNLFIETFSYK